MFEWTNPWGSILAALVCFFIILNIVMIFIKNHRYYARDHSWWESRREEEEIWMNGIVTAVLVVGFGFGSLISFQLSEADSSEKIWTNQEVASHFGFESGQVYPLAIGDRVGSYVDGGGGIVARFFSASGGINLTGGSTVTVGFANDKDDLYTLEIPSSKVTYKIGDEPSMVINLEPYSYYWNSRGYEEKEVWAKTTCKRKTELVFRNLWLARSAKDNKWSCSDSLHIHGLPEVVNQNVSNAVITLTQDMYDRLIGRIEPEPAASLPGS